MKTTPQKVVTSLNRLKKHKKGLHLKTLIAAAREVYEGCQDAKLN
jgi:hypothetical protein